MLQRKIGEPNNYIFVEYMSYNNVLNNFYSDFLYDFFSLVMNLPISIYHLTNKDPLLYSVYSRNMVFF